MRRIPDDLRLSRPERSASSQTPRSQPERNDLLRGYHGRPSSRARPFRFFETLLARHPALDRVLDEASYGAPGEASGPADPAQGESPPPPAPPHRV